MEETDGLGADLVCEAAGSPKTILESMDIARSGGRVFLYGIPDDESGLQFPLMKINAKQLTIHGTFGEPGVWSALLQLIADGRFNIRDYITHRLPLAQIADGFDMLRDKTGDPLKIVIRPNGDTL
jgi:threonine dehydrogenase-like Zn-dependent dehydrogenase